MKFWKTFGLVVLIVVLVSSIATVIEMNYCHSYTSAAPLEPSDYIKTSVVCEINSVIAVPGIVLYLVWKAPL